MRKKIILSVLLLSLLFTVNCGYKLSGSGKYIPKDLKSIAIPDFDNKTTEYRAEQFVTFAIRDEFIKRSRMVLREKVEEADALLEGSILKFDVTPVNYSSLGSVDMYKVTIKINVKLVNLKNNSIIYEKKNMSFTGNYEVGSSDFFSQESEALKKISVKFSASIVSAILENY